LDHGKEDREVSNERNICVYTERVRSRNEVKGKAVPLHAMALGGREV
jgi:hypothetical protein